MPSIDAAAFAPRVPAPVIAVCRALADAGYQAWLVGGAVRDLLLGRDAHDFDVATSARPEQVTAVFGRQRTIPTGAEHGTVTVLLDHAAAAQAGLEHPAVEVTTFRGEGAYHDGRRPTSVAFLDDIVEDLRRRDFTINALALEPAKWELRDPFGGQGDLSLRLIRAVGDARDRFAEDGLRVMRAVRLAAQLDFDLDPATLKAIPESLSVLRKVSAERVRDELLKLLGAPRPSLALLLMRDTGMLAEVLPEIVTASLDHSIRVAQETRGDAPLRMAALLGALHSGPRDQEPNEDREALESQRAAATADVICRRLRFANKERERIVSLVKHQAFSYEKSWDDARVRRFVNRVGVELVPDLLDLREGDVHARNGNMEVNVGELRRRIAAELSSAHALKIGDLALDGAAVIALLGGRPGPLVGQVLRMLLDRVLDEPELNQRESLAALVPALASVARDMTRPSGGGTNGSNAG